MKPKSRERILIVCCELAIVLGTYFMFFDTPHIHKMLLLKEDLKATDLRLGELQILTKGAETVEAEVSRLEKELGLLGKKSLKGEEFRAFLKQLARESDPLQLKIISLVPQEEKTTLPEGKKESSALPYRKVTVQMVVHSNYNKLGSYLKKIGDLPFLINVDNLQIERNEEVQPLLKVTMALDMYINKL
jgi:Tfp pilus assembly protein PilO